jgi:fructose-1,6-bisphosphatase II
MGVKDLNKKWTIEELANGPVMFCATGVTDGPLLKGVKFLSNRMVKTDSIVMRSESGTTRKIEALHNLNKLSKI